MHVEHVPTLYQAIKLFIHHKLQGGRAKAQVNPLSETMER